MVFSWNNFGLTIFPAIIAFVFSILVLYEGRNSYFKARYPPYSLPWYLYIIIWVVVFILVAIGAYIDYDSYTSTHKKEVFLSTFYASLLFVFGWFFAFFIGREPRLALVLIVASIASVIYLVFLSWNNNLWGMSLFIIYLAWLLFITFMNVGYITVNKV
jgi:tryptophan-rich sensory protein